MPISDYVSHPKQATYKLFRQVHFIVTQLSLDFNLYVFRLYKHSRNICDRILSPIVPSKLQSFRYISNKVGISYGYPIIHRRYWS